MPGLDLSEDRAKMRDLARRIASLSWVEPEDVEHVLEDMEKMDWGHYAVELTRDKKGYPKSAYCPNEETTALGGRRLMPGPQHFISNPARARKMVGTRRVGTKGRKMPTRAVCSGCKKPVVLVDNMVDHNWPLFIDKLIITEWP